MSEKFDRLSLKILLGILAQTIVLILFWVFLDQYLYICQFIFLLIDFFLLYLLVYINRKTYSSRVTSVSDILGKDAEEAFLFGDVGLVTYNEENEITWMSELFETRKIEYVGEKLTTWLPELADVVKGEVSEVEILYRQRKYDITRFDNNRILFFKDITDFSTLKEVNENKQIVLGVIHLDNYDETTQYEEDQRVLYINSHIRQPVLDWARDNGIVLRRLRSNRFFLILNEEIYKKLVADHFSILGYIRKVSVDYDVAITLSMSFARKSSDLLELEELVNSGLELAQGRGGDQIVVKTKGEEDRFIGGGSEALEKRSKVRVRVMAQTIKDRVEKSKNVIIVGHKKADFDCIGSAIGVSRIIQSIKTDVSIVLEDNEIEEKLYGAIHKYYGVLRSKHRFVNIETALSMINKQTLVIMVDHHSLSQCMAPAIVKKAKQIMVIDHHRRHGDFEFKPILSYIEPSASSASELVTELFAYQTPAIDLSDEESTLMYTGILIDTNRFRNRSGSRTFEAVSILRMMGADPLEADSLLKDNYEDFEIKAQLMSRASINEYQMAITIYDEKPIQRSIMSQVADTLLNINGVSASFVVGKVDQNNLAISARSNGKVNVQRIMEKMGGGGHFSAAAMQVENTTKEALESQLNETIKQYVEEVYKENESHPIS